MAETVVMLGIISSSVATKPIPEVGIRQNINQLSWGMGGGPSGSMDGGVYIAKAFELLLPVTLKLRRNDRGREVSAEL